MGPNIDGINVKELEVVVEVLGVTPPPPTAPLELYVSQEGNKIESPVEFNILIGEEIVFDITASDEDSYVSLKMIKGPEGAVFATPVWGTQPIRSISGRFSWTPASDQVIYGPTQVTFVAESFQTTYDNSPSWVSNKEIEETKELVVLIWARPVPMPDPRNRIIAEIKEKAATLQNVEDAIRAEYAPFMDMVKLNSDTRSLTITASSGQVIQADDPELVYYAFLVRAAVIPYYEIEPPIGVEALELPKAHRVLLISDPANMIGGAHCIIINVGPGMTIEQLIAELDRINELIPQERTNIESTQACMERIMRRLREVINGIPDPDPDPDLEALYISIYPDDSLATIAGVELAFRVMAIDRDAGKVELEVQNLPAGAVFTPGDMSLVNSWTYNGAYGTFTWTPTVDQIRDTAYEVKFIATSTPSDSTEIIEMKEIVARITVYAGIM